MSTAQQSYLLVISATADVIPSSGARAPMNSVSQMRISVTVDLWYDFTTLVVYKLWFYRCSPASACSMQREFTGVWWFCSQILLEGDYRMYFLSKMWSSLCKIWRWEIKHIGAILDFSVRIGVQVAHGQTVLLPASLFYRPRQAAEWMPSRSALW